MNGWTMNRKRWALVLMLVACAGVFGGWLIWPRSAITRENAAKIKVGMTLAEVEMILGGRGRDESTGLLIGDDDDLPEVAAFGGRLHYFCGSWSFDAVQNWVPTEWANNHLVIVVYLDDEGRVGCYRAYPARRVQESILDILRRWLRL
jgi:hypothetical protein